MRQVPHQDDDMVYMMSRNNRNPFKSMTYRLPATYAVIALVVVLALGLVLYATLRWYYSMQERAYLEENATPIAMVLQYVLAADGNQEFLQTQVHFFSFLARTRVEIFDADANLLASGNTFDDDSFFNGGNNRGFFISSDRIPGEIGFDYLLISPTNDNSVVLQNGDDRIQIGIPADNFGSRPPNWNETLTIPLDFGLAGEIDFTDIIPAFDPDRSAIKRALDRYSQSSSVVYSTPIEGAEGQLLGTLRLSEGPAYGNQIITGVMYGWLLASSVSVGLAIVLGWIASRDVVNPLRRLSKATQTMAEGDLTARVIINREDEFGTLSQSFNHMARRIEETVSTLRHFMSDAAHEINTPITALRTNLELLTPDSSAQNIERALSQVKRLENLTDNLLKLSRLESDIDSASLSHIDATALVMAVAQFHASQAEQANIKLILDVPDIDIKIQANEEQMQQALSNLLHNAIKFTRENGKIWLSVRRCDHQVHFTVSDTGIGILEADLPFLFNRFHRGRNTARFEGNGLGLAIVEAIVKRYRGRVRAENTVEGASFIITLPLSNNS